MLLTVPSTLLTSFWVCSGPDWPAAGAEVSAIKPAARATAMAQAEWVRPTLETSRFISIPRLDGLQKRLNSGIGDRANRPARQETATGLGGYARRTIGVKGGVKKAGGQVSLVALELSCVTWGRFVDAFRKAILAPTACRGAPGPTRPTRTKR